MRCCPIGLVVAALFAPLGAAQDVPSPPGLDAVEPAARVAALHALAAAPATPESIAAAAAAVLDPHLHVRSAAVAALLRLRPDLAELRQLLTEITGGGWQVLGDFVVPAHDAADLAPMARQLADASAEQRCAAIQALCGRGQSAEPYLDDLLALRADPVPAVRATLAIGIADVAWNARVRELQLALLKDEVASVRAAAATALGADRGEPELVAALRGAVQDPEVEVRAAVLRALGRCGKCGLAAVLDVLGSTRDREAKVRAAAFDAVASFALADARALRELGRGLADADLGVLRAAIQAAGAAGTGAESLLPRLLELTRHEHAEVRAAALQAAFAVADPARRGATVLRLVESLLDADAGVRTRAESCLRSAIVWG